VALADLATLRGGIAPPDIGEWLAARAAEGAERYNLVQGIELPPLITCMEDLRSFVFPESQPNFIGSGTITAPCVLLGAQADANVELAGRIVVVPQADPGFDWLFGHDIGGLITAYGGANSHMAIRSAEFGLPAAIGVGESLFEALSRARSVHLDCRQRRIQITE
jgi:phosphohistidine swiveling domain-containing protein